MSASNLSQEQQSQNGSRMSSQSQQIFHQINPNYDYSFPNYLYKSKQYTTKQQSRQMQRKEKISMKLYDECFKQLNLMQSEYLRLNQDEVNKKHYGNNYKEKMYNCYKRKVEIMRNIIQIL